MTNSKIIQILTSFSKEELKLFGDFVQSPFFNSSKVMVKLFQILKKRYPEFPEKMIGKEKVFSELHRGKKFNAQVYKNDSSEFLKLLKNFLLQLGLRKDNNTQVRLILSQYNSRFLDSMFNSALSSYKKQLNSEAEVDDLYFEKLANVEQDIVQFGLSHNKQDEIAFNVVKRTGYQIFHLYIRLLYSLGEIKTNEFIFNAVYHPNLPKDFFRQIENFDILKYVRQLPEFEQGVFEVFYYGVLASYFDENDAYYYRFKELVLQGLDKYVFSVGYNFLLRLESSCIKRTQRNKEFSRELFNVYNLKLQYNLHKYFPGSTFSIINFRNMLVVALGLNEIEWAEEFVEKYYRELPREHREWMYSFAQAKINFEKKNYDKTFDYLNRIDLKVFAFKFDIRSLLVKLFYETKNIEGVLHEIETYRQFLYKNKNVSDQRRTGCLNFLSFVNELTKIEDKNALEEFHRKVSNTKPVNDKDWLLRKSS